MLLPALLAYHFIQYSKAPSPQALASALAFAPDDLLQFFTAACNDATWSEQHPELLSLLLFWLTQQQLAATLPFTYFQQAAAVMQQHSQQIKELLPTNLTLSIGKTNFLTNTLLLATSSEFFSALIHRQCRIGKKTTIALEAEEKLSDLFPLLLEFIHTADIPLLWREPPELILQLHEQAACFGLEKLQELCAEIYKRYFTSDNVLGILLQAYTKGWKGMYQRCVSFISQADMEIHFPSTSIEELFFAFDEINDRTKERFFLVAPFITHLVCQREHALHPFMREAIAHMPLLRGLDITGTARCPEFFEDLSDSISYLNLSECGWLTDATLRWLAAHYPRVEQFIAHRCHGLSTGGWAALGWWEKLRILDISNSYAVGDQALRLILQSCRSIEEISTHECQGISDEGWKEIARHAPAVQQLDISKTKIGDETLIEIAFHCRALRHIDLSQCEKVTEKGIVELVKHTPALRSLAIRRCSIPLSVIVQLQERYPKLQLTI